MRALTEIEEAGRTPRKHAVRTDGKTGRYDDGTTDHDQQGSAVTLAGNVYRQRNGAAAAARRQAENLAEDADDRLAHAPEAVEDAKFGT